MDVLEVGLDGYVWAELLDANVWQWQLTRDWHVRERNARFAGEFRRVEEH